MELTFDVNSDLYVAGRTEDGFDFTAEVYFVTATDARGNRWRHGTVFPGCRVARDDEGYDHFADIREGAMAEAKRLVSRIEAAGGKINPQHWREDCPVYGSAAYIEYGAQDDWMEEQRERMAA